MRRKDREITDIEQIRSIIEKCTVMRVGMCADNEPYVVPINFGYEFADGFTFYFHCANEGKKLDIIKSNPNVFVELDCSHSLTEGKTACAYGYDYESVMGRGWAEIITEPDEKKKALSFLMKRQTGREFEFDDSQLRSVTAVKITVSEISCKARQTQ